MALTGSISAGSTDSFDIIIVGAGPAGSTLAAYLAKANVRVLLLDKAQFPRDKTCGDAIGGRCLKILDELGLVDAFEFVSKEEYNKIYFVSPNGSNVVIDIPRNPAIPIPSFCCRREVFDNVLFQNAKSQPGVTTIENFTVTDILKNEKGFVAGIKGIDNKTKQTREFRAKIVAGADGATSIVASKLGQLNLDPNHHCISVRGYYSGITGLDKGIEIYFIDEVIPGYFWIFPLEDGKANVGVGMLTKEIRDKNIDLKKRMFDAIKNRPEFAERFKNAKLISEVKGWTLPFGSKRMKLAGDGYVLLGDAASLIDPFSGEGIGNGMFSAKHAAPVIIEALKSGDFSEKQLSKYPTDLWNEGLGSEIKMSYFLQRIGKFKTLANFFIGKAQRSAYVRETISGMLVNADAKKKMMSPTFYLKLLFS